MYIHNGVGTHATKPVRLTISPASAKLCSKPAAFAGLSCFTVKAGPWIMR